MSLLTDRIATGISEKLNKEFRSLTNFGPVRNKAMFSDGYTPYSSLRGFLVPKNGTIAGYDETRLLSFQFNPEEIKVQKSTEYNVHSYTGLDYNDIIWSNGGEKLISFTLWFDKTLGSYNDYFNNSIQRISDDPLGTGISLQSDMEVKFKRGVLTDTDLIESFLRPEEDQGFSTPMFSRGGIVTPNQFRSPAVLIWVYGEFYHECVLKDASFNYTAFRKNLVPGRVECSITLSVHERLKTKVNLALKNPNQAGDTVLNTRHGADLSSSSVSVGSLSIPKPPDQL